MLCFSLMRASFREEIIQLQTYMIQIGPYLSKASIGNSDGGFTRHAIVLV